MAALLGHGDSRKEPVKLLSLKGTQSIAGGNAPGKLQTSPTLKGSRGVRRNILCRGHLVFRRGRPFRVETQLPLTGGGAPGY